MGWIFVTVLALIFLGPLGLLLGQVDRSTLADIWESGGLRRAIETTLATGLGGALVATVLGIYFARQFALYRWRGQRPQRLLLLLPYLLPNFILASAYVIAWNPGTGLLNPLMRFPLGLYGRWGMTFLFALAHTPVAFLLAETKFRRLDSSLREAARLSGASTWTIFSKIELPLLKPTIAGALGLCFSLNISAFAIPAWIGAPERAYPLTYKIYQAIQVGGADGIPRAAAFSTLLFLLAIPPLGLSAWANRNERVFATLSGKAPRTAPEEPSRRSFALMQSLYWAIYLVFFLAPLAMLLLTTIVPPGCLQQNGTACFASATLHSYHYVLFELSETRAAFQGSFVYGTISAAIVLVLTLLTLALLGRSQAKLRIAEWIFALPVATPGAVIALALIVSYSGRFWINLYNTAWIVVVAFVIKHMNLAFQPVRTGLSNISGSLLEASRLSGARPRQTWRHIVLPILSPEIFGGFFLVLIPILGELTMSIFLTSAAFRSIGTVLFDLQDYADQASAAALSVILIAVVLMLNEISRLLSRGKLGY